MSNWIKHNTSGSKTFSNLIQEVLNQGRCNQCGSCVSFCTAVNYGALGTDKDGKPGYADSRKCLECGICYMICPATHQLESRTRQLTGWSAPMGRVIDVTVGCAVDRAVRGRGTDGGAVTALLLHLLKRGRIDGAIVTRRIGLFRHQPHLARTEEELLEAAGSYFDNSSGMAFFGERYSMFSPSVQAFKPLAASNLRRIAFVGVPCQIKTLRKMQALGIAPAETVYLALGLFCAGNFDFSEQEHHDLEQMEHFSWKQVTHVNLREALQIRLDSGDVLRIPLTHLEPLRRTACKYCSDYSAEYADLSFGGVGAPEDWTTVVIRSPLGRAALRDSIGTSMREYRIEDNPHYAREALQAVQRHSDRKKEQALEVCSAAGKVRRLF